MKEELWAYINSSFKQRTENACDSLIKSILLDDLINSSYQELKELEYTLQIILLLENLKQYQFDSQKMSVFQTQYIKMDADDRKLMYSTLVDKYVLLSAFMITSAKNTSNLAFSSNEKIVNRVAGKYRFDLNLSLETDFSMKLWLPFRMFSNSTLGSTNKFSKEKPFRNQPITDLSIHFCKKNNKNYLIHLGSDYICGVCAYQHAPLQNWSDHYTLKEELESDGIRFTEFIFDENVPGSARLAEIFHTILKGEEFHSFFENCLMTFWANNPLQNDLFRYP